MLEYYLTYSRSIDSNNELILKKSLESNMFLTKKFMMYTSIITLLSIFTLFNIFNTKSFATPNTIGPEIGNKAPAFNALNTLNVKVNITELSAEKGLIVLFFRSADWCPFCKRHLIELNDYADKFKALGYGLTGISYDSTKTLNNFTHEHTLKYPLLSDQAANTIKAYDILNQDYSMGDEHYGIPYPGVVIINSNGKVSDKYFFKGFRKRVKFDELYEKLKSN